MNWDNISGQYNLNNRQLINSIHFELNKHREKTHDFTHSIHQDIKQISVQLDIQNELLRKQINLLSIIAENSKNNIQHVITNGNYNNSTFIPPVPIPPVPIPPIPIPHIPIPPIPIPPPPTQLSASNKSSNIKKQSEIPVQERLIMELKSFFKNKGKKY